MDGTRSSPRVRRSVAVVATLASSGLAAVALAHVYVVRDTPIVWDAPRVELRDEPPPPPAVGTSVATSAPGVPPGVAPAESSAAPASPTVDAPGRSATAAESSAEEASGDAAAARPRRVPRLVGRLLRQALRDARARGLRIVAREVGTGMRIPAQDAPSYRVVRQREAAGSAIEPGGVVNVRVQYATSSSLVMGY